ncbi:uncharacterized protein GGS25DRAFT_525620 [Hypoxylon fragiforme]|uniref:uncharacterized protein n=1 Tax=Hypoxylon fragiforme TaxID=63214 RepID=UPI0020C6867B|nr:uncharacterized protein GGS25DRAFT_525620 [Hypoxylon fragiforme]KAI2604338.1 hypothetical protein GGS25DRAFT_525620 [Hypoxylon fragiforme]
MIRVSSKAPGNGIQTRFTYSGRAVVNLVVDKTSEYSSENWYTSDEVKVEDCTAFDSTGACDQRNFVREEESEAGGLCDDCTREHDGDV